jgi:energy-coupling factor transport system permease protein
MSPGRRSAAAPAAPFGRAGSLGYRRLASPLHATRAGVGALWALALTVAALVLYNPLALAALALAILVAARGAGVGRTVTHVLRTALIVALPIVAINVLVARQGLTVFARLGDLGPFGQGNLTVEALVYGAVIGLKVTITMLVTALASLAVDPDALLASFRRLSFRSALTASLATRMIPVLAADARRLSEAQRTRPEGPPYGARGRAALIGAVIAGSLDRALDVAATLEVRGFAAASGRRPADRASNSLRRRWSRHDLAFATSALAVLALALLGRLTGAASFEAYPSLHIQLGGGLLALCIALPAAVLLPFCDRRGIEL